MIHRSFSEGFSVSRFDQESIVYGVIRHLPSVNREQAQYERLVNRSSIDELPSGDLDEGLLLMREMFAQSGGDVFTGAYQTQLIHFGASFRGVEYEWEHWIERFESLLKSMYWNGATVHLETELSGKHTFHWHSEQGHTPSSEDLRMVCEWERESAFGLA